jgi:hypothetical protein
MDSTGEYSKNYYPNHISTSSFLDDKREDFELLEEIENDFQPPSTSSSLGRFDRRNHSTRLHKEETNSDLPVHISEVTERERPEHMRETGILKDEIHHRDLRETTRITKPTSPKDRRPYYLKREDDGTIVKVYINGQRIE